MLLKKVLIILFIVFYYQLIVKAQVAALNNKNTTPKTIIRLPAQQEPGNENMPLFYNTSNTRIEIGRMNYSNSSDTFLNSSDIRWSSVFGTSNSYNSVYDLFEYYDKGYYIVGRGEISSIGHGWNIKTDINGEMFWYNKLIKPGKTIGRAVCQDTDGNTYITGIDFSETTWPFLIKLNSCNEKQWCTVYKDWGYIDGYATDVIISDEGNIIVLTRFENVNGLQINQIFLLCYSPEGELLWSKPYATKTDYPLINVASGERIYRLGSDYVISGYCYYPYPDDPNHVWMRPMFIGIDSAFNEKWMLPFGVNDSVVGKPYSAIPLNDSILMGVGFTFTQTTSNARTSSLMFINNNGEELGCTIIPGDSIAPNIFDHTLVEIESINDSLFMATAVFGPSDVFNPYGDMIIDTSGKVYNAISRPNTRGFSNLIKTYDNKFVIACSIEEDDPNYYDILLYKINENLEDDTLYTQNFVYDSLCPDTIVSGNIDMSDCMLQVGFDNTPTPETYHAKLDVIHVEAFPNPAQDEIMFTYTNTELHNGIMLQCYTAMGQKVYSEKILQSQQGSKINLLNWNSGLYIATITINGRLSGNVKFVVR